jgi:hypothetical protein
VAENVQEEAVPADTGTRRDEWMMMPPEQDDLAARMDPTRQRPRGFNTSKRGQNAHRSEDGASAWHETIAEKQTRLANEMMGISKTANTVPKRAVSGMSSVGDQDGTSASLAKHIVSDICRVMSVTCTNNRDRRRPEGHLCSSNTR